MKKSDIAMIVLIVSISVLISYFIAKSLVGDVSKRSVKVQTAEKITSDLADPDPKTFNSNAINPTVEVNIGGSSDTSALRGTQ